MCWHSSGGHVPLSLEHPGSIQTCPRFPSLIDPRQYQDLEQVMGLALVHLSKSLFLANM